MHEEKSYRPISGWLPLFTCLGMLVLAIPMIVLAAIIAPAIGVVGVVFLIVLAAVMFLGGLTGLFGLMAIAPNEARVLLLFGEYKGTALETGFFWVNPFFSKKKISLRIRNFETGSTSTPEKKDAAGQVVVQKVRTRGVPSKVNDRDGNPI